MVIEFVSERPNRSGALADTGSVLATRISAGIRRAGQFMCGVRGHVLFMHFEPQRLSLQCVWCGYESPGWEIGRKTNAERRRVVRAMKRPAPLRSGTAARVA